MAKKSETRTFDPRSAAVVLRYVGDGRPIAGIPTRDLTESDLCRIVHRQALVNWDPREPDAGPRPDPLAPDQAAIASLAALLVERGTFTTDLSEPAAPATDSEPAAPATEG